MPKGPRLSDYDKDIIAQIYNRNRGSKAELIRHLASQRLHREIGLSTIQRELAKLRVDKRRVSTDPIDDQWSLASLSTYPIDSKDINFLLFIQATFEENVLDQLKQFNKQKLPQLPFMTNRLAIWISRLLPLISSDPGYIKDNSLWIPSPSDPNIHKWNDWVDDLVTIAMFYSDYEISCELTGIRPVNTINFDAPTLFDMKRHIIMYHQAIMKNLGIESTDDPDLLNKMKVMDIRDLAPKGGKRNARPYNKKR